MRNNFFKQESENKVGGQAAGKQKSHKNEFSRTCKYELWWQRFNKVRRLFFPGCFFLTLMSIFVVMFSINNNPNEFALFA